MPDIRLTTWVIISCILLFGTTYSIIYNTYIDTSNPLLAHEPHPLGDVHYFANKSNFLNTYFIKRAWAWTSAAFFLLWFSSPPSTRTGRRMAKWVMETGVWLVFTSWFFGPALLERVILFSGGECVLSLPSGDHISVPEEYCFSKSFLSPTSHPDLFTAFSLKSLSPPIDWHAIPRLRRGHDVSGHIFLLTMSALFLADQLRLVSRRGDPSMLHTVAIIANLILVGIWLFACYTTCLYYHTPLEKFTGYLLGMAGFAITQLPGFSNNAARTIPAGRAQTS